jgi:hypothetical protein
MVTAVSIVLMLLLPAAAIAEGAPEETRGRQSFVEEGLEYVAVAPTNLARFLNPLIEWKLDRGVVGQIFTIEAIYQQYTGRDNAERLHNFLQDLYFNLTEGSPRWLLLGGDAELLPVRYLWANRDHSGRTDVERNLYIGDMYYGHLESDWDLDGDDVFGEPGEEDPTPELYVGRIAAIYPEELEAAVEKTLEYELDPPGGDWFNNAFLAGALMDEPNYLDDPYTRPSQGTWTDEGFDPYTDNAYEITQRVRGVLGDSYDFIELNDYPYFEGCNYTPAVDTLNYVSSTEAWKRGNAMVFWASHGYEGVGALAEYYGDGYQGMFDAASPYIVWQDTIDPVTGGQLPLVYMSSCYSGQFDKQDKYSFESMLTVREGGAIALIAGDGDTFRMENISYQSYGNWWLSERFWRLVIDEGRTRPGEALGELKREYHEFYMTEGPPHTDTMNVDYFYANLYSYNLQGDPEVPVWIGTPGRMAMEVAGGAVVDAPQLRVRVYDNVTGLPIEGATVHVRGDGLPGLLKARTDAEGIASIVPGSTELGGTIRLAVTKDGWVPVRETVTVAEGVRDLTIEDDEIVSPGHFVFNGTIVEYSATVRNLGDFSASTVVVEFDSGNIYATGEGIDAQVQTKMIDLPPGGSETVTFSHRYLVVGQYILTITVDPQDAYPEVDENNNEVYQDIVLRPLPYLPESIGPFSALAGEVRSNPIDLDYYVKKYDATPWQVEFEVVEATVGLGFWIDEEHRLQLRPDGGMSGTATVTVMMMAGGIEADRMTVQLDVGNLNEPPIVKVPTMSKVDVGETLVLFINASDPEGGPVTSETDLDGAIIEGDELMWTPGPSDVGLHIATITVRDRKDEPTYVRITIEVLAKNQPPQFVEVPGQMTIEKGAKVLMAVQGQDPDGEVLEYRLAMADFGFTIDPRTGLVTFNSEGLEPGEYSATVVASDGSDTARQTVTVEVEGTSGAPVVALFAMGLILLVVLAMVVLFRRR